MADEQSKSPAPVSKWVYPFSGVDDPRAATPKPKEIADPNTYFSVLSMAEDGFYPVGANGLWHGGIHFDGSTAGALMQGPGVRCMADGEVIAYRIDSAYPELEFEKGKVAYSRGFVLVKHRLQLPPAPQKPAPSGATTPAHSPAPAPTPAAAAKPASKTSPSSAPAPAPQEPSLVFFSLYMHLIDWAGYRADAKLARPAYWGDECKRVVGDKAPSLSPYAAPQTEHKGVNVRQAGKGTAQIGWLPPGTAVTLEPGSGPWRKIASVDGGQMEVDPLNRADTTAPFGWVFQSELTPAPAEPKTKDAVCVLDKPMAIKAGELIGHLGQYQRHADAGSILTAGDRPLVHIEVFSGEDVKVFIEKSRARAKELEPGKKTLLVVSKGTKLVVPAGSDRVLAAGKDVQVRGGSPSSGEWAEVTEITVSAAEAPTANNKHPKPKVTPTGDAFWVERAQLGPNGRRVSTRSALDGWTDFPLQQANATGAKANYLRVAAVKTLKRSATDDKGVRWWLMDVDEAEGKGNTTGWICEKGNLQSPWDWPGFEIVEERAVKPADLHGKQVVDHKLEIPEDKDNFEAKADRAKEGALFQKLYDVLDTDKDEKLSTAELRAALRKPWLAQTLSRLIVRYESEWGGAMGKWDALDAHMGEFAGDWAWEKLRIYELQWWSELAGKHAFPSSPVVYHFHPVGLAANFPTCSRLTLEMLQVIFPNGDKARLQSIVDEIGSMMDEYKLATALRLTHFFAQVREETGPRCKLVEDDFTYSPDALKDLFGYFAKRPAEADLYGKTKDHGANFEAIEHEH